jgi:hypothetical protein
MTRLSNLYRIKEMARTHGAVAGGGPAIHGMLDWASQQEGEFTIKDMLQAYIDAGGQSISVPGFTIMAKKYTALPGEAPSPQKPIVMTKQGSRGRGNPGMYAWGLDGPLRAAPEKKPVSKDPLFQTKTNLEDKIGVKAYRDALARWKRLGDLNKISADIKGTIPARYQMDALHIAATMLHSPDDAVDDAEHEIQASTPFPTPKPKAVQPVHTPKPKATQANDAEGGDGESDDVGFDDDIPADFFHSLADDDEEGETPETDSTPADDTPEKEPEPQPDDGEDETPTDEPDDSAKKDYDDREYPIYLPDPDEDGDRYENAMFRIVDESEIDEHDPIWEKLKNAKDGVEAHSIIKGSNIPSNLHRSALLVAKAIFENTGRDWETGKKNESRLASLYGVREAQLDPVDFDQESGLKRIMKIR